MSTGSLDARFAATLAQDAYRLKNDITRRIVLFEYKDKFEVEEELKGKTGALVWVLKKIMQAGVIVLVGAGSTTFTILDRLAYMMHKAYNFTKDLGYWVMRLIKRIARAIGIVVTETTQLTATFIRMILPECITACLSWYAKRRKWWIDTPII